MRRGIRPLADDRGAAEKYGVYDLEEIVALRGSLRGFSCERTSLANGVDGERFHLMKNLEELDAFDRTHVFKVEVDGEKLLNDLEAILSLIREEAEQSDESMPKDEHLGGIPDTEEVPASDLALNDES